MLSSVFGIQNSIFAQQPLTQDTIKLGIQEAEQRFINKNLTLLLNQYNVNIAQASYLQARLWYNPNLTYQQTFYNQESKKFFDNNYPLYGQTDRTFQVQQLITIAGRHSATAKLAKVSIDQAKYQLADVLRSLKYELYTDLSDLYSNQQQVAMYMSEESKIKHLIQVTQQLYKLGNAAGNDVIRLQAQLQDVIEQEVTNQQALNNDEKDLKILLVYPANTYLVATNLITAPVTIPTYEALLDSAEKNRPDLMLANTGVLYQQKNLALQHASQVPDVTLGVVNVGAGTVVPNYWGLSASMDLPVFNHNQWNVATAKYQVMQAQVNDSIALNAVTNEVTSAYITFYRVNNQLHQVDTDYERKLDDMMDDAVKNYDHRYINLLDLLSQISTYIDGKNNLINLQVQYFNAIHYINFTTGLDIIK